MSDLVDIARNIASEFIRQYFTVLSKNPHVAHRFYGTDSYLVYGSLDEKCPSTACGAESIREFFDGLNLENCHTRVQFIDSIPMGSEGILIQVIGDRTLNDGIFRRFAQTFYLGATSSDKYYVRSNIYRCFDETKTAVATSLTKDLPPATQHVPPTPPVSDVINPPQETPVVPSAPQLPPAQPLATLTTPPAVAAYEPAENTPNPRSPLPPPGQTTQSYAGIASAINKLDIGDAQQSPPQVNVQAQQSEALRVQVNPSEIVNRDKPSGSFSPSVPTVGSADSANQPPIQDSSIVSQGGETVDGDSSQQGYLEQQQSYHPNRRHDSDTTSNHSNQGQYVPRHPRNGYAPRGGGQKGPGSQGWVNRGGQVGGGRGSRPPMTPQYSHPGNHGNNGQFGPRGGDQAHNKRQGPIYSQSGTGGGVGGWQPRGQSGQNRYQNRNSYGPGGGSGGGGVQRHYNKQYDNYNNNINHQKSSSSASGGPLSPTSYHHHNQASQHQQHSPPNITNAENPK